MAEDARPSRRLGRRKVRLNHAPFLGGQIGLVARRATAIVLAGGRGPHENLQAGRQTTWNHTTLDHSTPFETASESRFRNSCGSGDASNEEHDGGSVEEGSR